MNVRVEAAARLHMGFVDLHGGLGRRFGSIGVGLREPRLILRASPAPALTGEGPSAERAVDFAACFYDHYKMGPDGTSSRAHLEVLEAIPPHVGLGSGTQLALAVGSALARLHGVKADAFDIAKVMERGGRSSMGIGAFAEGGFMVDGGRAEQGDGLAPLIARQPLPADWIFVIATPKVKPGLSGDREDQAFGELARPSEELAGAIARLLVMTMLPALVEGKIERFGRALTEIQRLVGDSFAPVQGGRYANRASGELIEFFLKNGAVGAGQSSWGPTVYGLVRGRAAAQDLRHKLEARPDGSQIVIHLSGASERGALIVEQPG